MLFLKTISDLGGCRMPGREMLIVFLMFVLKEQWLGDKA